MVSIFADKFAEIYSSNNSQHATELEREYEQMRSQYCGVPLTDDYLFDTEIVANVFAKLKRGKAPGLDTLSAEHLLHSHPALPCLLSKLFNLMLKCGHVPPQFGHSYTVPIPKLHDCRTKAITTEDFRGIAISPILSKVLNIVSYIALKNFLSLQETSLGSKKVSAATMQYLQLDLLLIVLLRIAALLTFVHLISLKHMTK